MIYCFRFCLSRHVLFLAPFDSSRACDRRLKLLVESGYLERKKILYGIPYLYYLSKNGMRLIHAKVKEETIRVDRIYHDIAVLDSLPHLIKKYNFDMDNIVTERELHMLDGFGVRKHHPDLVFQKPNKENDSSIDDFEKIEKTEKTEKIAIEFEFHLKARKRFDQNIEDNYLHYQKQIWVVPQAQLKILNILTECQNKYDNIEVITLESLLS